MPKVLIVSSADLTPELGQTVLWRSSIQRVFAAGPEAAFEVARTYVPGMVLVDGADGGASIDLVRRLRENAGTRRSSVVVLSRSPSLADEEPLRHAGANLILAGQVDPALWDARLEELLSVPRRRDARIPVRFEVWSQADPDAEPVEALALNVSVHGMLLETGEPLDLGTRLDLAFTLPGHADELRVVGQVVREAEPAGRPRSGILFLILRGDARDRIRVFIAGAARD